MKTIIASPAALQASPCPCGSGDTYAACCGRWHAGALRLQAIDAAVLMRSRYSAFVLGDIAYLLDSWHPSTRPQALQLDAQRRWLGLELRRHLRLDDDHAEVEFVARSKLGGRAQRLHESSRFVREQGCWYYLDGVVRG